MVNPEKVAFVLGNNVDMVMPADALDARLVDCTNLFVQKSEERPREKRNTMTPKSPKQHRGFERKKLLGTSASLLVTSALLVVTRSY